MEKIKKITVLIYPDGKIVENNNEEKIKVNLTTSNQDKPTSISHTEIINQLRLVAKEEHSDKGHFSFLPKGALIHDLIGEWLENMAVNYFDAMSVKTPTIYKWGDDATHKQMEIFDKELYKVIGSKSDRLFILRPNSDIGLFKTLEKEVISTKILPLRFYERALCFRLGQSGSLSGIKRARSFSLIDIHSFCANIKQGKSEYEESLEKQLQIIKKLGLKSELIIKTNEKFFNKEKKFIINLVKKNNKTTIVEIYKNQTQYWSIKHIITVSGEHRLFHSQLDSNNGELHHLSHTSQRGKRNNFVIVHNSLAAIERWITIFLNEALLKTTPALPLWLAPIQIRIIPVNKHHLEFAYSLAKKVEEEKIRVDIDDTKNTINRRIMRAEKEWIPYIIVIGKREVDNKRSLLNVRIRGEGRIDMSLDDIINEIQKLTQAMPFKKLPGLLLSKKIFF